jgi:DNA-binding CsgD family transcriptional regulator
MIQLNDVATTEARAQLRLVVYQPPEHDHDSDERGPAKLAIPYELRDYLAHKVAAALEGLDLAEADGVQEVAAAAAEDAAYPLNQLIDVFSAHYRTTPGRARSSAMRMVRSRMGVPQGRCWQKVSARERREQIASFVREGMSREAIAVRLGMSIRTVERHKHAAGLTSQTSMYDTWARPILAHLRAFPNSEFTGTDLARVLRDNPRVRFTATLRRLEREGQVVAVPGVRDPSSPTIKVTRWRLGPGQEGNDDGDAEV